MSNMTNVDRTIAPQGLWQGASDHDPIICTSDKGGSTKRDRNKSVSKMKIGNTTKVREVEKIYAAIEGKLVQNLQNARTDTDQQVYKHVTKALAEPWEAFGKRWPGQRPSYWKNNLEDLQQRKAKA